MIHPETIKRQRLIIFILVFLILATVIFSLGLGTSQLSFSRIIPVLLGQGNFNENFVLFSIRLPRLVITLLAGMALALSGSILQGLSRNDLADPGIIGINSGAGFAVALFFLYFPLQVGSFIYLLPLVAFAGALITAILIYFFSYDRNSGLKPIKLILVGVGFSTALSGAMMVLISSADRSKVEFISRWLAGDIWGTDWPFVLALLPWLLILLPAALYMSNRLNILALGNSIAVGVGMRVEKEQAILLAIAVGLAAASVSVTGGIAFVGLMAPHIAKTLIGKRHQLFMPIAILIGGWLLLLADTIGRNIFQPQGVAAGIMVAVIGAPYFIYLLTQN
ncbi:iron complex transport system permease protein [Halanaerobium saccharolyticum]|uniref:Iron complex transport system permease protein n=1 Tax=Halanaerobium saccharolyticum TaxID=43595 RepID=A0A4R7YWD0_9FIRM|nr:iron ABC transporter permease [Halanaerobium saccharolyticum]RAK10260.1 iron complex transport system permease protein [Halanaerobium saccharolyticum]TDW00472.1 iron complex transport system permease protein [Halanaerobium saccharolyticum]TDX52057.1 iron complex transport system permease protein [Halanaerobium saccharolyticum]